MSKLRAAVSLPFLGMATIVLGLLATGCPDEPDRDAIIDAIEFVWCPPGSFDMGCDGALDDCWAAAQPQHEVTFTNGFWMSKYEVTNLQWWAVTGSLHGMARGDNYPVDGVSWDDVQAFVATLNAKRPGANYCIPSEAQWEYACRAGTTTFFYWGDDPDRTEMDAYAWVPSNSGDESHPVGQKTPNAWGLYDMSGNMWEWMQDRYHADYVGAPTDGSPWEDGADARRVVRGGSFFNSGGCRSDYRGGMHTTDRWGDYGFRLVMQP